VSELKAPVSPLVVTAWSLVEVIVEVLVKVAVRPTSEILLNDMAMLDTLDTTGDEEKKDKELEPEMEGNGLGSLVADERKTEVLYVKQR
jgi:hypothetical protein